MVLFCTKIVGIASTSATPGVVQHGIRTRLVHLISFRIRWLHKNVTILADDDTPAFKGICIALLGYQQLASVQAWTTLRFSLGDPKQFRHRECSTGYHDNPNKSTTVVSTQLVHHTGSLKYFEFDRCLR
jgi:hypothetical protein